MKTLAVALIWLELGVNFTFTDGKTICPGGTYHPEIYFSAEVENGKVRKALIQKRTDGENPLALACDPLLSKSYEQAFGMAVPRDICNTLRLELTASEVAGIEVFQHEGEWWLKRLPLGERLAPWLLYHYSWVPAPIDVWPACPLRTPVRTMSPLPLAFEFETEGVKEGIGVSYSDKLGVQGDWLEGRPYNASFRFRQRRL